MSRQGFELSIRSKSIRALTARPRVKLITKEGNALFKNV